GIFASGTAWLHCWDRPGVSGSLWFGRSACRLVGYSTATPWVAAGVARLGQRLLTAVGFRLAAIGQPPPCSASQGVTPRRECGPGPSLACLCGGRVVLPGAACMGLRRPAQQPDHRGGVYCGFCGVLPGRLVDDQPFAARGGSGAGPWGGGFRSPAWSGGGGSP